MRMPAGLLRPGLRVPVTAVRVAYPRTRHPPAAATSTLRAPRPAGQRRSLRSQRPRLRRRSPPPSDSRPHTLVIRPPPSRGGRAAEEGPARGPGASALGAGRLRTGLGSSKFLRALPPLRRRARTDEPAARGRRSGSRERAGAAPCASGSGARLPSDEMHSPETPASHPVVRREPHHPRAGRPP